MNSKHPFLSTKLQLNWRALTPEHIEPDLRVALQHAEENLNFIRNLSPSETTFHNTFAALEMATDDLDRAWGRLNHLDSVVDTPEQRKALNKMLPEVTAFYSKIPLDSKLWDVLSAYAKKPEALQLPAIEKRLIDETLADFRTEGADLPEEQKQRLSEINAELAQLTQKYGENGLDATKSWEHLVEDPEQLRGIPENLLQSFQEDALSKDIGSKEKPVWRFTLQAPCVIATLQYAENEQLRKTLWEAYSQIAMHGEFDNTPLVHDILRLRNEKAQLLGHESFADLTLQRRMAKSGNQALHFTEDLHQKIHSSFQNEVAELQNYRAKQTDTKPAPLQPWSTGYWMEKHRRALHDFDEEELRPYFPIEKVLNGMFTLLGDLFGFAVIERKNVQGWHQDVNYYDLHDTETNTHLGSFYTDWHPRETKRGGAWMNFLETCHTTRNEPHIGLICGNLTKPTAGKPSLLTHREVETIFHEFGHLLHHLLTEVPHKSLAGTQVAWDFVELPSQIMENFCWERQSLDQFARHYETGEPIPESLFQKMLSARNHMSASAFMRQLSLGKLDLELHHNYVKYAEQDLEQTNGEILAKYRVPLDPAPPSMIRNFGHLFSSPTGYAAGYYSYKWAEVLDADAFTRFQKEGLLNPETGQAFRKEILSKGNSTAPEALYQNFMNRAPSPEPLLVRSGLAK